MCLLPVSVNNVTSYKTVCHSWLWKRPPMCNNYSNTKCKRDFSFEPMKPLLLWLAHEKTIFILQYRRPSLFAEITFWESLANSKRTTFFAKKLTIQDNFDENPQMIEGKLADNEFLVTKMNPRTIKTGNSKPANNEGCLYTDFWPSICIQDNVSNSCSIKY